MLYKIEETKGVPKKLTPLPFGNVNLEKHLEDLMASSLAGVLFEDNELMPIFQERKQQPEADIYALNENGDLVIFELKRGPAGEDAVYQALRYCETAAHWDYNTLQSKLATYLGESDINLSDAHRLHFGLEQPLRESAFNVNQRLLIVGVAGNEDLVRNVNYWRSKGLDISFIPYRVFNLANEHFFEFFSPPYDRHANPAHAKGVLFDTNRSWNEDSIWYMCEKSRVAAFGGVKDVVHYLGKGDTVFLYHPGYGIVAAGEVKSDVKSDHDEDGLYRDLKWLTVPPIKGMPLKAMPAWQIKQVLDRNFWWAKTLKTPYLSVEESKSLLESLRTTLQ